MKHVISNSLNIETTLLHEGSTEIFLPPFNFDSNNSDFDLFNDIETQSSPDIFLHQLKNILIDPKGIIYDEKMNIKIDIYEPSEQKKYNLYQQKNKLHIRNIRYPRLFLKNIYKKYFSKKIIHLADDKSYVVINDDRAINNIYHWFCDSLIKLIALGKLSENQIIILSEECWNHEYVQSSLSIIGISKSDILILPRKKIVHLDSAAFISSTIFTPSSSNGFLLNKLRELIYKSFDLTKSNRPSKKIYLSRKNSKCRNVSNNIEFSNLIKSYGFESICGEDYTLKDIVLILINTKYLMGVCGANLTHAIFMQKEGFLIELIHENYFHEHPWPGQYEEKYYGLHRPYIANSLSLNYLYIPCKPSLDIDENSGDPTQENLIIDLMELKNQLDKIM